MTQTEYYGLKKPATSDFVGPDAFNDNADLIDAALHGLEVGKLTKDPETGKLPEAMLPPAPTADKATPADADWVTLTDTAASSARKKLTWSSVKATLKGYFDSLYAAATHTHAWSAITGKPSTFAPSSHTHAWSAITGKPSSFAPSAHAHAASDVTSGTLSVSQLPTVPVSKGGTGAATAAGARENLGVNDAIQSAIGDAMAASY